MRLLGIGDDSSVTTKLRKTNPTNVKEGREFNFL